MFFDFPADSVMPRSLQYPVARANGATVSYFSPRTDRVTAKHLVITQ
nr:hypothetical protein [Candidatus Sigynarchaeota archaeon]